MACLLHLDDGLLLRRLRSVTRRPLPVLLVAPCRRIGRHEPLGGPHNYDPVTNAERHIRLASNVIVATLLILVVAFSGTPHWFSRALPHRAVVAVGRWSYGIFLWHMSVILVLNPIVTERRGVLGLAVWIGAVLAVSIPLGAATYAWVEQPAIRWSKRSRNGEAATSAPRRHAADQLTPRRSVRVVGRVVPDRGRDPAQAQPERRLDPDVADPPRHLAQHPPRRSAAAGRLLREQAPSSRCARGSAATRTAAPWPAPRGSPRSRRTRRAPAPDRPRAGRPPSAGRR